MNKKILALAVAATMAAPMATHADVKVSGIVQAEVISLEVADGNEKLYAGMANGGKQFDDMDRQTLTNDHLGTILNEGPNHFKFDLDEKLGGGLSAEARYIGAFNASGNGGQALVGDEAWVGLRTPNFHVRYGTLTGVYKSSHTLVDPWAFTSLQARGTGGGMSGEYFNIPVVFKANGEAVLDENGNPKIGGILVNQSISQKGLTNDGLVSGALELGINFGGFSASIQGIVDDTSNMDGAGLLELRYTAPQFTMWLSGAYQDLDDVTTDLENIGTDFLNDTIRDDDEQEAEEDNLGLGNWKIGGQFRLGPMLTLGLQYEDAEIGALDTYVINKRTGETLRNQDGGAYILGSLEFNRNNISIAGWVSGYLSDLEDKIAITDSEGNELGEDALSWAVGLKYLFSKRTMVYAGYRQTDSDNDFRDENVATMGIRHVF